MKYFLTCFIGEEHLVVKSLRRTLGDRIEALEPSPRGFRGLVLLDTSDKVERDEFESVPTIQHAIPILGDMTGASPEELTRFASEVAKQVPEGSSFAVRVTRRGDHSFTSCDLEEAVGREILERRPDLAVELEQPDFVVGVQIVQDWAGVTVRPLSPTHPTDDVSSEDDFPER